LPVRMFRYHQSMFLGVWAVDLLCDRSIEIVSGRGDYYANRDFTVRNIIIRVLCKFTRIKLPLCTVGGFASYIGDLDGYASYVVPLTS
jgi:hypothetical protein